MDTIRKLTPGDKDGYLSLLFHLNGQEYEMDSETFSVLYKSIEDQGGYIAVLVHKGNIVSSGKLFKEKKFGDPVGHIEDVVTRVEYRGNGYGKLLVEHLLRLSKTIGCYKTVLKCRDELIPFYEKAGMKREGSQMIRRN